MSLPLDPPSLNVLADRYIRYCQAFNSEPDPSVVTSLATEWTYIKASNGYSLLPLFAVIQAEDDNKHKEFSLRYGLETLRVKAASGKTHLADANARAIAEMLPLLKSIKNLLMSQMGLAHHGALAIFRALKHNSSLQKLDISYNPGIGPAIQTGELGHTLNHHPTLRELNVKNNQLGFAEVAKLRSGLGRAQQDKGKEFVVLDSGNNVYEEVLNAVTHGVGCLFAIVGASVMMYQASTPRQPSRTYYAALVYCCSLVFLYFSSTLLHAFFMYETASSVLGVMDHAAIYFLIAGSYFPLCIVTLGSHPLGTPMAITEWVMAFFGISLCVLAERVQIPYKMVIELVLYLCMGWMITLAFDDFKAHINPNAIDLIVWGGLMYTGGITFFILEKTTHPIGHAIWHLFVLAGTIFHYFAILFYVVGYEDDQQIQRAEDQLIAFLREMMERIPHPTFQNSSLLS